MKSGRKKKNQGTRGKNNNRIDNDFLVLVKIGVRRKVICDFFGSFVFEF